jgi:hypothetical protein
MFWLMVEAMKWNTKEDVGSARGNQGDEVDLVSGLEL